MFDAIGWDFDGVLADSRKTAFSATEDIARIFGISGRVNTMVDYRRVFGEVEARYAPERVHSEALRALHRLVMRARTASVPVFESVLRVAGAVTVETAVISSSLRGAVIGKIRGWMPDGCVVLGHEDGLKEDNLAAWSRGRKPLYVTDTISDVDRCRAAGVYVVGVGWGFDAKQDLVKAGPDWFVDDSIALKSLLKKLKLLSQYD